MEWSYIVFYGFPYKLKIALLRRVTFGKKNSKPLSTNKWQTREAVPAQNKVSLLEIDLFEFNLIVSEWRNQINVAFITRATQFRFRPGETSLFRMRFTFHHDHVHHVSYVKIHCVICFPVVCFGFTMAGASEA